MQHQTSKIGRSKTARADVCAKDPSGEGGKTPDILSEPKIYALAHYLRVLIAFIIESIVEGN